MELRWVGAVLVVFSCGGFGLSMANCCRKEEQNLKYILRILQYMECEIQYRLTALPELCRQAADEAGGDIRDVFLDFARELDGCLSPDVRSCMATALQNKQVISRRVRRILLQIGRSLGRFDLEGQVTGLKHLQEICAIELKTLHQNKDSRLKSYQTLGICAGIALVIIFI